MPVVAVFAFGLGGAPALEAAPFRYLRITSNTVSGAPELANARWLVGTTEYPQTLLTYGNQVAATGPQNAYAAYDSDAGWGPQTPVGTSIILDNGTAISPESIALKYLYGFVTALTLSGGDSATGPWTTIKDVTGLTNASYTTSGSSYSITVTLPGTGGGTGGGGSGGGTTPTTPGIGAWRAAWFGSTSSTGTGALIADPAGDGISNAVKYYLGLNPLQPQQHLLPAPQIQSGYMVLGFDRNQYATDATGVVQVSNDLTTWNSGAGHTVDLVNTAQRLEVRSAAALGTAPIFMRLKVTAPDGTSGGGGLGTASAVITFEDLNDGQATNPYINPARFMFSTSSGLQIKTTHSTKALRPEEWNDKLVITHADGLPFSLTSFDYHGDDWDNPCDATVTGFQESGSTVTSSFNGSANWATLTLNWINLTKVEIDFSGGINNTYGLIDNLKVSVLLDVDAPSVPTNVQASNVAQSSFSIAWTNSTDDRGVAGYEIFLDGTSVGTSTTTSHSFTGLTPSTTYSVTVKAKDAANNASGASTPLSVRTKDPDLLPPSVPAGLRASSVGSNAFALSWDASTDDNSGVANYEVYMDGVLFATSQNTSAMITGLSPLTSHVMTVKARDAVGNLSGLSAPLTVITTEFVPTPRISQMGINLNNPGLDWMPDKVFADAMRSHRSADVIGTNGGTDGAPKDANYWPTSDCSFLVWAGLDSLNNHGTYKLHFRGSATVKFNGFAVSNMAYDAATNTSTADFAIPETNNSYLALEFANTKRTASSATNTGVTEVKLMRPLTPGSTSSYPVTTLFMDQYIGQLAPFKCLRALGWVAVNWNQDSNWSDRTLMQHARQSPPKGGKAYGWEGRGASYESLILFANQAQKDIWLTIPHKATDDYVTKLAQLFKYGSDGVNPYTSPQANPVYPPLDPDLKLYVEHSNEIWNDQFVQTEDNYELAQTNPIVNFDNEADFYEKGMRLKAVRTVEISMMFRSVFGADMMTRVRPVLCSQKGYVARTYETLSFIDRYYNKRDDRSAWNDPHPVNYYLYGFGNSFYWYADGSAVTIDSIWTNGSWDATRSFLDSYNNPAGFYDQTAWDSGMAKQFGLAYVLYEGDLHPVFQGGDEAVCRAMHTGTWDARLNQNTLDHLQVLARVDAELYNFLNLDGYDNSIWALRNVRNPANSPQLDAIATFQANTLPAITLGYMVPFTAPGAAFHNKATQSTNLSATGSTTIQANASAWGTSVSASYLFRVPASGTYDVSVTYRTTAPATMELEFAGNVVATYNLATTGTTSVTTPLASFTCAPEKVYSVRPVCASGTIEIVSVSVTAAP